MVSHRTTAGSRQGSCLAPDTKTAVREMTPPRENRCSQMNYCAQTRNAKFQRSEITTGNMVEASRREYVGNTTSTVDTQKQIHFHTGDRIQAGRVSTQSSHERPWQSIRTMASGRTCEGRPTIQTAHMQSVRQKNNGAHPWSVRQTQP
jgi:hypothetical protein